MVRSAVNSWQQLQQICQILKNNNNKSANKTNLANLIAVENEQKRYVAATPNAKLIDETVQFIATTTTNTSELELLNAALNNWLTHQLQQKQTNFLNEQQIGKLWQWQLKQLQLLLLNDSSNNLELPAVRSILECADNLCNIFNWEQQLLPLAQIIIQLHYDKWTALMQHVENAQQILDLGIVALSLLRRSIDESPEFAQQYVSEIFGLYKMYMQLGSKATTTTTTVKPQKVLPSQQGLHADNMNRQLAEQPAKRAHKLRRPRAVPACDLAMQSAAETARDMQRQQLLGLQLGGNSDSEAASSEQEKESSVKCQQRIMRYKQTNLRLNCLILLCATILQQQRQLQIYGYWHVLLPTGGASMNDECNLLYIAQQDSNSRCRSAALQVLTQLFYGATGYLSQAEFVKQEQARSTFMPFAQSLGLMLQAIYHALCDILCKEASMQVNLYGLKCLATLLQATTFPKQDTGLPQRCVQSVRNFLKHADMDVCVAALIVYEMLLQRAELTPEILETLHLPTQTLQMQQSRNHLNDSIDHVWHVNDVLEHMPLSDEEEEEQQEHEEVSAITNNANCWLLDFVLAQLDKQAQNVRATHNMRIKCLQVLALLLPHIQLDHVCMQRISNALINALEDNAEELRLHAARALDKCAYQLSARLDAKNSKALADCKHFWLQLMPIVSAYAAQPSPSNVAFKVSLCDALANINAHIFESLSHALQINLISLLCGIAGDSIGEQQHNIRASAVRALSMFANFPTLRDDIAYLENIIDLCLRLLSDCKLLQVRIKVCWSLANISDVQLNQPVERIGHKVHLQLIPLAMQFCAETDKLRCNAVRLLCNLLVLLNAQQLASEDTRVLFQQAIGTLRKCLRNNASAKTKWNTCFGLGRIFSNSCLLQATQVYQNFDWQTTLFEDICHIIVHHGNFKVRTNAAGTIAKLQTRQSFGQHYAQFWQALLEAILQSNNLENYFEYNHRDSLQEQLCLSISHLLHCAQLEDLNMLKQQLEQRFEIVANTWTRVANRMLPEKVAPLLECSMLLRQHLQLATNQQLTMEQKSAINLLLQAFSIEAYSG